jgi:Transglutaminase-like superfamily
VIPRASRQIRTVLDGLRIVPAYLLLGLLKHLVPLRWLAKWTWCKTAGPRDRLAERRLTANALRLSKLLRIADRDCLQRSLLLYRLLSALGADPELVVGLREQDGKIIGHAWVLVDGKSLVEPESDLVRFSPVLRFGARGALLQEMRAGREPKTLVR